MILSIMVDGIDSATRAPSLCILYRNFLLCRRSAGHQSRRTVTPELCVGPAYPARLVLWV
jgi:hypothetical protein